MELEQYSHVRPVPGLVIDVYSARRDIGAGIRMLVVYKVGRKFIHMFYAPQLLAFRVRQAEWALMYKAPLLCFHSESYLARIRERMAQYDRNHIRYSVATCRLVFGLNFTCGHELFGITSDGKKAKT